MLQQLKNLIFSQTTIPSEYENRLRKIIKEKSWINFIKFSRIFVIFGAVLLLKNVLRVGGEVLFIYIIVFGVILTLLFVLNFFKRKQEKSVHFLLKAIDNIRKNQYELALDKMLEAYKLNKSEELLQVIIDFSNKYPPNVEQEILIAEFTLKGNKNDKVNDKKLAEILSQIHNISEYILKHKKFIVSSSKKISELKSSVTNTEEERLKTEYKSLVKRYQDIIELENSKIEFYSKAKNELIELKNNHIVTQKLFKEKEELKDLEDTLLEKSIEESNNTEMTVNDFISYENAYLEAIQEYSEKISSSRNQNLFEDIIRSFKDKTELL